MPVNIKKEKPDLFVSKPKPTTIINSTHVRSLEALTNQLQYPGMTHHTAMYPQHQFMPQPQPPIQQLQQQNSPQQLQQQNSPQQLQQQKLPPSVQIHQKLPAVSESQVDYSSAKGVFGWACVDNENIPYIMRDGKKFVSVRMVEQKLLSRFPAGSYPDELKNKPPLLSHHLTFWETRLMNEVNMEHCNYEYGNDPFTEKDLVVKLSEFEDFYSFVKKVFLSNGSENFDAEHKAMSHTPESAEKGSNVGIGASPPTLPAMNNQSVLYDNNYGWLQVNNTVVPYVVRNGITMVPLSIIHHAAGLLVGIPVQSEVTGQDSGNLNDLCTAAGLQFHFKSKTKLVQLKEVNIHANPSIMLLNKADPFGSAIYTACPVPNRQTEQQHNAQFIHNTPITTGQVLRAPNVTVQPSVNDGLPNVSRNNAQPPVENHLHVSPINSQFTNQVTAQTMNHGMRPPPPPYPANAGTCMPPTGPLNSGKSPNQSLPSPHGSRPASNEVAAFSMAITPPAPINSSNSAGHSLANGPSWVKAEQIDGKWLSVLDSPYRNKRVIMVDNIAKVLFPQCEVDEFQHVFENVLKIPVYRCDAHEEKAFIQFYGLPYTSLKNNSIVEKNDLLKFLPQLKYTFKDKETVLDDDSDKSGDDGKATAVNTSEGGKNEVDALHNNRNNNNSRKRSLSSEKGPTMKRCKGLEDTINTLRAKQCSTSYLSMMEIRLDEKQTEISSSEDDGSNAVRKQEENNNRNSISLDEPQNNIVICLD